MARAAAGVGIRRCAPERMRQLRWVLSQEQHHAQQPRCLHADARLPAHNAPRMRRLPDQVRSTRRRGISRAQHERGADHGRFLLQRMLPADDAR